MNIGALIAVFLPIFLLLFVFIPQTRAQHKLIRQIRNRVRMNREADFLASQLVTQCLGKNCLISTGLNGSFQGTVIEIADNWMKVESKGVVDLINCDYIQSIRELPAKKQK